MHLLFDKVTRNTCFDRSYRSIEQLQVLSYKPSMKTRKRYEYPKNLFNDLQRGVFNNTYKTYTDLRGLKLLEVVETTLTSEEIDILLKYYKDKLTDREIGEIYLTTQSHISNIRVKILSKLRDKINDIINVLYFGNCIIDMDNEKDPYNTFIDDINISNEGLNLLISLNVYTLRDITQFTEKEFRGFKEFFKLSESDIDIIVSTIHDKGIDFLKPLN